MATSAARTYLAFQHNAKLNHRQTIVKAIHPFSALAGANRALYKSGTDDDHVVITEQTIFHPQGGGQPSDTGSMYCIMDPTYRPTFHVATVRMDAIHDGQVLHFGRFTQASVVFKPGDLVTQTIDTASRLLFSRLHTAGHILGAAVRHLVEKDIPGFDELKASHFPDAASCEFKGLIDGKWKAPIQQKVDEYVAAKMPVEIEWWDEDDFKANGLQRLIPDRKAMGLADGEKFRVVNIKGAEVYPCGGTHVDSTDLCGITTVKKISRSKGISRVSYTVAT